MYVIITNVLSEVQWYMFVDHIVLVRMSQDDTKNVEKHQRVKVKRINRNKTLYIKFELDME